ncbi:hypothetical protein J6590_012209 [Homalodisca vitripennis]|nr:hypothetical protein J6590_012209 [Homalodisca vitripennis]
MTHPSHLSPVRHSEKRGCDCCEPLRNGDVPWPGLAEGRDKGLGRRAQVAELVNQPLSSSSQLPEPRAQSLAMADQRRWRCTPLPTDVE